MTDNEIIKALDERISSGKWIGKGFLDKQDFALLINSLDLINRQKAEIERLKGYVSPVVSLVKAYEIETAKAEAIKEFAKRLKEETKGLLCANFVDDLVKEMVGDSG